MAYTPFTPILLTYTGLSVTAGSPVDVATIPLPVTGLKWVFRNPVLYHLGMSGDIGSTNTTYQLRSESNGGGAVVMAIIPLAEVPPGGATVVSAAVTGWMGATGVTLRSTADCPFSQPLGLTISAYGFP